VIGTVLRVCRVRDRLPELNGERIFKLLRERGDQRWTDDRGMRPVDLVHEASRRRGVTNPCALVLVHGGLSSSGAAFEKLDFHKLGLAGCSVCVFEHDTCRRVVDNADELATCVAKLLANCSRVLFLAHSRGGLVAREAVSKLPNKLRADAPLRRGDVRIVTCGTPHLGTPILRDAAPLINALCVAAGFLDEVPRPDPTLGVLAYLAGGLEKLPQGLEDVAPDSALIKRLKQQRIPATTSFAGVSGDALSDKGYRPNTLERVRYRLVRRIAKKLLLGGHDAVVPTDSASAAGSGIVLKDCSHWGYFARNETLAELQQWLVDCQPPN
jgi:pimeloyl-ACP methyl ester carboxylesterase